MNAYYLIVTPDGNFKLLSYLPNKKYFSPETKIFELPDHTSIQYIYKLVNQTLNSQIINNRKLYYEKANDY